MEIKGKFCPVCKNKNERNAVVCIHCGASFDPHQMEASATTRNAETPEKISAKISDAPIDNALIPRDGIAIYAAGTSRPVYLRFEKELIFGRRNEGEKAEELNATLLDLTSLGGYQMGLSRRHALIRRTEDGYILIDLASTNGSWLNDERLTPNKPYPLPSGSQIRFGRMRLLILYNPLKKKKKAE